MAGRERWLIPALMCVFALGGTSFGMAEESLAFYALVITVMIAAGYDALTGAAVVLLGCGIGVLGSTVNPFATGIASGIAGISISDGLVGRLVILIAGLAIGIFFVLRYADRVRKDPSKSVVYDMKAENEARFRAETERRRRRAHGHAQGDPGAVRARVRRDDLRGDPVGGHRDPVPDLVVVVPRDDCLFPLFAIIIGLIARMGEGELTGTFVDGARDLLGVALIIGIARGITVIMNNGQITDTVLHWVERALGDTGEAAFTIVMFALFLPLSFLIPSSSGLATLAMPITAPLAGFVGCARVARRDRIPERLGPDEPVHPDIGRRHGWPRHRPRPLRDVPPLGLAAARLAHWAGRDRARSGGSLVTLTRGRSSRDAR